MPMKSIRRPWPSANSLFTSRANLHHNKAALQEVVVLSAVAPAPPVVAADTLHAWG